MDEEITQLLSGLYDEAYELLRENRHILDRISEALLERETLEGRELKLLVEGKPLPPVPTPATPATPESGPPPEKAEPAASKPFPGDKLPDPEPVPG